MARHRHRVPWRASYKECRAWTRRRAPTRPCTHFRTPLPRHAKRPLVPTTPPPPKRCNRISGRGLPPRLRRARRTRQRRASRAQRLRRPKLYTALDVGRADHRPPPSPAEPARPAHHDGSPPRLPRERSSRLESQDDKIGGGGGGARLVSAGEGAAVSSGSLARRRTPPRHEARPSRAFARGEVLVDLPVFSFSRVSRVFGKNAPRSGPREITPEKLFSWVRELRFAGYGPKSAGGQDFDRKTLEGENGRENEVVGRS